MIKVVALGNVMVTPDPPRTRIDFGELTVSVVLLFTFKNPQFMFWAE